MKKWFFIFRTSVLFILANLACAFSYTIPDPEGDVTVEFRLIYATPPFVQINADVHPGQTMVVDSANFGPDTSDKRFIHLFLHVGWDSMAFTKKIILERTIVSTSNSGLQMVSLPYAYPYTNTGILLYTNGVCDTIRQVSMDGKFLVVTPSINCVEADVHDQDSLLALLKQMYDTSGAVFIVDSIPTSHKLVEVGYNTSGEYGSYPSKKFNRHDTVDYEQYNFKISQKLKGSFTRDTITFESGRSTYTYNSSFRGVPVYHPDSIKTAGVNPSWSVPGGPHIVYLDYRIKQWLVFSRNSPVIGNGDPGFTNGFSCPYELYRDGNRYTIQGKDAINIEPVKMRYVISILHDSLCFKSSPAIPLSAFLKSIRQSKVVASTPNIAKSEPAVLIRNGSVMFTANGSPKEKVFEVSVYSISGRTMFLRAAIAPGASICRTNQLTAGTYLVLVKTQGSRVHLKTTFVSIFK